MERAAVLIGVNRTGQLPTLNAAVSGAVKMAEWAEKQSIPANRIIRITDQGGKGVTVAQIKTAISELARLRVIEQLIIYFAGHGMYTNGSEFWLLTGAPNDSDEAVNVARSQDFARIGVFNHVIFISDACRTAAVGRQFQDVRGSSIFNSPDHPAKPERSVDLFFACGFDSSSIETASPERPTNWQSIYTDTLYDALSGDFPLVLDSDQVDGSPAALVRTHRLKPFLTETVPDRIIEAGYPAEAVQTPDARVCSPASAWVSLLCPPPDAFTDLQLPGAGGFRKTAARRPESEISAAQRALSKALMDANVDPLQGLPRLLIRFTDSIEMAEPPPPPKRPALATTVGRIFDADSKGPQSFETGCGFVLSGAKLADARVIGSNALVESTSTDAAKIQTTTATNVLLRLSDGRGTVLPAIPGFIATLTFQSKLLISVSWQGVDFRPDQNLQATRALVASLSQRGGFHLDTTSLGDRDAERLANRIRDAKIVDPSMAVYAAYAFYDLQLIGRLEDMADFLATRLQLAFFDFALLTRSLGTARRPKQPRLLPFFPLLSRGWPLLASDALPPGLSSLYNHLTASQWSLFEQNGVRMIEKAIDESRVS